jgi:hypothetical protein
MTLLMPPSPNRRADDIGPGSHLRGPPGSASPPGPRAGGAEAQTALGDALPRRPLQRRWNHGIGKQRDARADVALDSEDDEPADEEDPHRLEPAAPAGEAVRGDPSRLRPRVGRLHLWWRQEQRASPDWCERAHYPVTPRHHSGGGEAFGSVRRASAMGALGGLESQPFKNTPLSTWLPGHWRYLGDHVAGTPTAPTPSSGHRRRTLARVAAAHWLEAGHRPVHRGRGTCAVGAGHLCRYFSRPGAAGRWETLGDRMPSPTRPRGGRTAAPSTFAAAVTSVERVKTAAARAASALHGREPTQRLVTCRRGPAATITQRPARRHRARAMPGEASGRSI